MYHFLITYAPYLFAINSAIALYKSGNKDKTGRVIHGISQIFWIIRAPIAGQYYLMITSGAYLILAIRNYKKRSKEATSQ